MTGMKIRVVDLETTGLAPPEAEVVEIAWVDLIPRERIGLRAGGRLVRPSRPIPPQASAVHHIIDDDLTDAFEWGAVIADLLHDKPDILVAHNTRFERQFLTDELTGGLPWICTYKAALRLWPQAPGHSNQTLRYWRKPAGIYPSDRAFLDNAHRALPDAVVTAHLLREMLAAGADIETLIAWEKEPALQIRCGFGKHRGTPWRELDDGFLAWVAERDFDEDVLFTVRHEMRRRREAGNAEARA